MTQQNTPDIRLEGLTIGYGEQAVVSNIDAVLPADRIIAGDSTQPVYAANHTLPAHAPRS